MNHFQIQIHKHKVQVLKYLHFPLKMLPVLPTRNFHTTLVMSAELTEVSCPTSHLKLSSLAFYQKAPLFSPARCTLSCLLLAKWCAKLSNQKQLAAAAGRDVDEGGESLQATKLESLMTWKML